MTVTIRDDRDWLRHIMSREEETICLMYNLVSGFHTSVRRACQQEGMKCARFAPNPLKRCITSKALQFLEKRSLKSSHLERGGCLKSLTASMLWQGQHESLTSWPLISAVLAQVAHLVANITFSSTRCSSVVVEVLLVVIRLFLLLVALACIGSMLRSGHMAFHQDKGILWLTVLVAKCYFLFSSAQSASTDFPFSLQEFPVGNCRACRDLLALAIVIA
ncbi:hypothetical protein Tco_1313379 [Tanacetum coccineum]